MNVQLEEAKEWLYFSGEDLQSAELLLREKIYSQACFHAQQCVEKALKAFIVYKSGSVKKIHDLNELINYAISLDADCLKKFEESVNYLNKFYTPTRYPDAAPGALEDRLPNEKDAAEVLKIAEIFYSEIIKMVNVR